MGTLNWLPFGMCGVQAELTNGKRVTVNGYQIGSAGGFALTYNYGRYLFTTRADAYQAAELLNTSLHMIDQLAGTHV